MHEIPCPSNNEDCKYYPNCHLSLHHEVPRRLVQEAIDADYSEEYLNKLRRVVKHPSTHTLVCRQIHDLLDTNYTTLPGEDRLDRQIRGFDERI